MNDDLISRKEALELIRDIAYSMELSTFECKLYGNIYDAVKDMTTAFDKEKVIEELKGEIELCVTHPLYPGRYIKKERAIGIVEKGGV